MNKEKQIEEMAVELWHNTTIREAEMCDDVAEYLYNAGYRKADKVAREIFEEIENNSFSHGVNFVISKETIAELKKKYTEEGKCSNA